MSYIISLFFTHYFHNEIKINSISPLKSDNYVSVAYMKDLSKTPSCLRFLEFIGLSPS